MKLYNEDFNKVKLEEKARLILTDIPYNIGRDAYASNPQWWKNGDISLGYSEKADSKFFETDEDFNIDKFLEFCQKHLLENSSVIVFCSYEQQFEIINKMKNYGFKKYIPLVFVKNNSAECLKANMRICGACEYGLQICNGKFPKFNNDRHLVKNWFTFNRIGKKLHPNEKPVELLEEFIKLFTDENETVIDCCMGSGSTGEVCLKLNRNFIGIEIDQKYFEIAYKRLN